MQAADLPVSLIVLPGTLAQPVRTSANPSFSVLLEGSHLGVLQVKERGSMAPPERSVLSIASSTFSGSGNRAATG